MTTALKPDRDLADNTLLDCVNEHIRVWIRDIVQRPATNELKRALHLVLGKRPRLGDTESLTATMRILNWTPADKSDAKFVSVFSFIQV